MLLNITLLFFPTSEEGRLMKYCHGDIALSDTVLVSNRLVNHYTVSR